MNTQSAVMDNWHPRVDVSRRVVSTFRGSQCITAQVFSEVHPTLRQIFERNLWHSPYDMEVTEDRKACYLME